MTDAKSKKTRSRLQNVQRHQNICYKKIRNGSKVHYVRKLISPKFRILEILNFHPYNMGESSKFPKS